MRGTCLKIQRTWRFIFTGRAVIKDDDISSLKDRNDGAHAEMERGGKLPVGRNVSVNWLS